MGFHSNEIFGAMSTTMLGAAKNITAECRKGFPKRIIIQTGNANIIITNTGSSAFLMCMFDSIDDSKEIIGEIDKAAEKIKDLL
jgi:predicted regulator of Ras-like GTPase activity (Roadblock/LC7/MglB family)